MVFLASAVFLGSVCCTLLCSCVGLVCSVFWCGALCPWCVVCTDCTKHIGGEGCDVVVHLLGLKKL